MSIIKAKGVKKRFETDGVVTEVLNGLDIDFPDNKITTITGPSGSGKSTFLYLLGALDIPTEGDIFIDGVSTRKLNKEQLIELRITKIRFIFQFYNLLAGLSVRENIEVALTLNHKSISKNAAHVDELLELVNLKHRENFQITKLSGGEQQRVAIARALVNDPQIIIADEPTGNLDSVRAKEVLNILSEIGKSGKTIIIVTHDEEVNKFGDFRIRIKDGKVIE